MNSSDPYVVVEESDVPGIIPALVEVLNVTRDNEPNSNRFDWLYLNNPDGKAVVWTLRRRDSNEILGFTACLPRQVVVQGKRQHCWIGADFSILPKYRSLGLALRLRRAAKQEVDSGRAALLYSHPNDRMAVIHEKVGHLRVGTMIRLARLISVRPLLEERRQTRLVAGIASRILDPVMHAASSEWRTATFGEVRSTEDLRFTNEFDDLFESEQNCSTIVGVRDSRYLTWRYSDNPLTTYRLLTLRDNHSLLGYAIYVHNTDDNGIYVTDLFPARPARVVHTLLKELWRIARQDKCRSISMTLLESSPLVDALRKYHYRQRPETSQMFTHAAENSGLKDVVSDPGAWYITVGDRDV